MGAALVPLGGALLFPKFWILLAAYAGKLLVSGIVLFVIHRRWMKQRAG